MALVDDLDHALAELRVILDAEGITKATQDRAQVYHDELSTLKTRLSSKERRITLIGPVGVGKTSVLTALSGLIVGEAPKTPKEQWERSVLTVGSGNTTAFPITVRAPREGEPQDQLGLTLTPLPPGALRRMVEQVAAFELYSRLPADQRGAEEAPDPAGEELRGVVLNMTGYAEEVEKYFDGNLRRYRTVKPLDAVVPGLDLAALTDHLLSRIQRPGRVRDHWPLPDDESGLSKLKQIFERINLGLEPQAIVPERLELVLPRLANVEGIGGELVLLDTRGLNDAVSGRPDLFEALRADDTLLLLCSSFNDAPSDRVREVLIEMGRDLTLRPRRAQVVLLLIDKGESEGVVAAKRVREHGQQIRVEQALRALRADRLDDELDLMRVIPFDPLLDSADELLLRLGSLHQGLREQLEEVAKEALGASEDLRHGDALVAAYAEQLDAQLNAVLRAHRPEGQPLDDPLRGPRQKLESCPYAFRIYAALRWRGEFPNLHLFNAARVEARSAATAWLDPLRHALMSRLDELEQGDLSGARGLIRERRAELVRAFERTVMEYGEAVGGELQERARDELLWLPMLAEWGGGAGFRGRVINRLDAWANLQTFTAHRSTTLAQHVPLLGKLQAPEEAPGFVLDVQHLRRLRRLRWPLHGLNLLVGANGSGKTTVFTALRFFWRAMQEGGAELAAVMELRALSGLRTWGVEEAEPVRVALERGETRWEFELRPHGGEGLFIRERLIHRGGEVYNVGEDRRLTYRGVDLGAVGRESGLRYLIRLKKVDLPLETMSKLAESLRVSFSTDLVGLMEQGGTRPLPVRPLESRGQNAYSVLQRLKDAPGQAHKYEFVLEVLHDAFPDRVESLAFEVSEQNVTVFVIPPGDDPQPNTMSQEAEGLIQLLVNLVAVASANPGDVIALDEPDSHLHPIAAKRFIHHVERWAWEHKLTILIATHSVVLLNEMWQTPDRVFVMKPSPKTKTLPMPLTDWYSKAWFAEENNAKIHLGRLAIGDLYATASMGSANDDEWT